jgi:hypothetical protein
MIPVAAEARPPDGPAAGVCPAIHERLARRRAAASAAARLFRRTRDALACALHARPPV